MSTAAPGSPSPTASAPSKPGTTGYHMTRPMGRCAITDQPIEPGSKFMAALRETPAGFERIDISIDAWPQFDRRETIGFWQTVMPHAEQKKKVFVDDQVLCDIFERLSNTTEPAKLNFRFVLGLILMRKRMIVYEDTRVEAGSEIWKVRFKGRDDQLDLVNPRLNEQQVMEVSQQLSEILNEEL
jgi:hypothetical protein